MNSFPSGVSVIVCCYNSASRLEETIRHLALQQVSENIRWEIIIINNASTDNTYETAIRECQRYPQLLNRFSVVNEPRPGLSFARERGINLSTYAYIIFCDDDNRLAADYIDLSYQIMENNLTIGALGGQSDAVTDISHFPDWFEAVKGSYAVGKQAEKSRFLTKSLWGAGLITRKKLYHYCFPKEFPSYLTGRNGDKLSAGEDSEYCIRLQLKGYKIYYDERLKFTHFIAGKRLNPDYLTRMNKGFEEAIMKLHHQTQLVDWNNASLFGKTGILLKKILGYLSTITGRRSWKLADLKTILYFMSGIDTGVDADTRKIYSFYKDYHPAIEETHDPA